MLELVVPLVDMLLELEPIAPVPMLLDDVPVPKLPEVEFDPMLLEPAPIVLEVDPEPMVLEVDCALDGVVCALDGKAKVDDPDVPLDDSVGSVCVLVLFAVLEGEELVCGAGCAVVLVCAGRLRAAARRIGEP